MPLMDCDDRIPGQPPLDEEITTTRTVPMPLRGTDHAGAAGEAAEERLLGRA
jgi:hypothetical protein